MTRQIFSLNSSGDVVHTTISAVFIQNPSLADWLGHIIFDSMTALMALPQTLDHHGKSDTAGNAAFSIAMGSELPRIDILANDPVRGARFFNRLKCLTSMGMFSDSFTIDTYPWHKFETIVDVRPF